VSDSPVVSLIRYDAACRAIAKAKAVDEVKRIRDSSIAMRAYAKQAKNRQLELDATEIRIRAERRVGELIAAQRETVGLHNGGRPEKTGLSNNPVSKPTLAAAGIDKNLAERSRKLAAMPVARFNDLIAQIRMPDASVSFTKTAHKSESPEHYTPHEFLESVYRVFDGHPDLDPCAESQKNPNVPATKHYTEQDDGLSLPWHGKVFLNPPYGREILAWMEKLRAEWTRGDVTEIIALLPARTDTEWFDVITRETDDAVICFLFGRLTFVGNHDPAPFPSMAVYFGPYHNVFAEEFIKLGSLWQRPGDPLKWFVDHS
jgi:hypothetical protein